MNLHLTQLETLENVDLPHGVDDRLDVKVLKRLDVRFIEEALQKQHALVPARAARAFGVAQVDGRKAVRIGEGLDGILKTVAVGIGLDDRPEGAIADHSHEGGQDCASAPEYQFQRIWDGALEYSSFISQGNPHGASRAETR